jgi:hypothetical protein
LDLAFVVGVGAAQVQVRQDHQLRLLQLQARSADDFAALRNVEVVGTCEPQGRHEVDWDQCRFVERRVLRWRRRRHGQARHFVLHLQHRRVRHLGLRRFGRIQNGAARRVHRLRRAVERADQDHQQ